MNGNRPYDRRPQDQQQQQPPIYVSSPPKYPAPTRQVEPPPYSANDNKYDLQQESDAKVPTTVYQSDENYEDRQPQNKRPEEYKNDASSSGSKKHYPVIIGRYQVTDSRAFLPQKVEDSSPDKHKVPGAEEYVVYYLPYGQPLPVPVRRRKRSSVLRSLADMIPRRRSRGNPEEIQV